AMPVSLHDGSKIMLKKLEDDYDPRDRARAFDYIMRHQAEGQIVTGLLYIDETRPDMHEANKTVGTPLVDVPYEDLCPGSEALAKVQERYR
ncbi:MAG TPA: 2-oxoacid:ferredoxin oxidoreductase subunit beta, partial [Alphaproteobacteria bacterium]|nr:2-oxoacid:ferredoxin oxidoreductase subunit beta [Alphaproteobacteria bacterium]